MFTHLDDDGFEPGSEFRRQVNERAARHRRRQRARTFGAAAVLVSLGAGVLVFVGTRADERPALLLDTLPPVSQPVDETSPATTTLPASPEVNAVTSELARYSLSAAAAYTPEQYVTISRTISLLVDQCMSDLGIEYRVPSFDLESELDHQRRTLAFMKFDDRDEIERTGYESTRLDQGSEPDHLWHVYAEAESESEEWEAYVSASLECDAEAARTINPDTGVVFAHFPADLDEAGAAISRRVREDTLEHRLRWLTCMIDLGFGGPDNLWNMGQTPPEVTGDAEIAWALGDYDCRQSSGITAARLAILEAEVAQYITDNETELARLAELRAQETARAQAILDGQ